MITDVAGSCAVDKSLSGAVKLTTTADSLINLSVCLPVLVLLSGLIGLARPVLAGHDGWPVVQEDAEPWKTGSELEQAIGLATSVRWSGTPLGERLRALSRLHRISVFIDRRVDPTILVELRTSDVTFEQLLWKLAEACSTDERRYGVARIGDVFYFGPEQAAIALPAAVKLIEIQTGNSPVYSGGPWEKRSRLSWEQLASPRDLVRSVCEDAGVSVTNDFRLQHDVWPAWDLPALKIEEQLTLLLIGFDQVYLRSEDGNRIEIISFPQIENGPQKVAVESDPRGVARRLRREYPELDFSADGRSIEITGSLESAYAIRRRLARERVPVGGDEQQSRFTLNTGDVATSRGDLLNTIAHYLDLQMEFDEAAAPLLSETMTFSARNEKIEDILDAVIEESGLSYTIDDGKLTIKLKE